MTQIDVLAKPSLSRTVFKLMRDAGGYSPGYREPDGTTYRILDFHGDVEVPAALRNKFAGAVAEWANDSEYATNLVLYKNVDDFGAAFACIDIVAERI